MKKQTDIIDAGIKELTNKLEYNNNRIKELVSMNDGLAYALEMLKTLKENYINSKSKTKTNGNNKL